MARADPSEPNPTRLSWNQGSLRYTMTYNVSGVPLELLSHSARVEDDLDVSFVTLNKAEREQVRERNRNAKINEMLESVQKRAKNNDPKAIEFLQKYFGNPTTALPTQSTEQKRSEEKTAESDKVQEKSPVGSIPQRSSQQSVQTAPQGQQVQSQPMQMMQQPMQKTQPVQNLYGMQQGLQQGMQQSQFAGVNGYQGMQGVGGFNGGMAVMQQNPMFGGGMMNNGMVSGMMPNGGMVNSGLYGNAMNMNMINNAMVSGGMPDINNGMSMAGMNGNAFAGNANFQGVNTFGGVNRFLRD